MTPNKPSLLVERLIVIKSGCKVYDQRYHVGVNIVRGKNSPGKSTILSFIFYALGGEHIAWTSEQLRCDKIYLDVKVNGRFICLQRDIVDNAQADIYVHDGDYETGHTSEKWLRFSRTRTASRESFSEFFFNALGLPVHKTDLSANLTMYQILRLMFFDQTTSNNKIMREDTSFDSKDTRQAIGDYLLGLDNLEARTIRQKLLELNKLFGSVNGQVTAIHSFLGKDIRNIKVDVIENAILDLKAQAEEKNRILEQIALDAYVEAYEAQGTIVSDLLASIQESNDKLLELESRSRWLTTEITDNEVFLLTLQERVNSLNQSKQTAEVLESVTFKFCPLCLAPLEQIGITENVCHLCKHEHAQSLQTPYSEIVIELSFQIRETQNVLDKQKEEYDQVCLELPSLRSSLERMQSKLRAYSTTITPKQATIESLSKAVGHIEAKISQEESLLQYAQKLSAFYEKKQDILSEQSNLTVELEKLEVLNRERDIKVRRSIEKKVISYVKQDVGDDMSFDEPQSFDFNFRSDSLLIDSKQKISDSSMVILKNSFALALLTESTRDPMIRLPQFLLLDNIEDKGMREDRSANFQRMIVKVCETIESEFQIIMTTSMIDTELNNSPLCVGPFYDRHTPTLDFSVCK